MTHPVRSWKRYQRYPGRRVLVEIQPVRAEEIQVTRYLVERNPIKRYLVRVKRST